MRILIIGKYYAPFSGGIEANTQSIAEFLSHDHDVTVLVSAHDGLGTSVAQMNGVCVIRKRVHFNISNQPVSLGFFGGVDFKSYDVIHFHAPNPYVCALILIKMKVLRSRPPLVITHHMDIYGRRLLREMTIGFYRKLVRLSKGIIVTSRKNFDISADIPRDADPIVIPLGVDPRRYEISDGIREGAKTWRQELAGDAPLIGFLGRHARYKGLDVLMRAIEMLPGVCAVVAGDGVERQAAERLARELGVSDRVRFIGQVTHEEKLKLLTMIDVFAFPSTEITEAFGVSQMEAMVCGAAVVATNLPTGVTDVAIHEKTALLAEPGSAASFAEQVRRFLESAELSSRISAAGRLHILDNMNEELVSRMAGSAILAAASS